MPLPSPNAKVLPDAERVRITKELDKIASLADAGVRGTSPGSVTRYALNRVGGVAKRTVRRETPKRTGTLRQAIGHLIVIQRPQTQLWYVTGYLRTKGARFQQILAIEHGTKYVSPRRIVSRAFKSAVGTGGSIFLNDFVAEMNKRIAVLAAKANSGRKV